MSPSTTTNSGFFASITSWLATPFNSQGSALRWVLFVGLVIVAVFFWQIVLLDLTKEVKEV